MSQRFELYHPEITKENKISVYKITFDCGMFYIGSTVNLKRRIIQYRYNYKNRLDVNKKVKVALLSHNSATLTIIESCFDKQAVRLREDFHLKSNSENPLLLNRSISAFRNEGIKYTLKERYSHGNGMRGKKLTPEQRKKWSDVKKGVVITQEHREKISAANKGRKLSEEHREKLSIAKKGKPMSEENKKLRMGKTNKKVDQFDLLGNFIKRHNSYSEAAKELGCQAGHIGEVVKGIRKSKKGFVFKEPSELIPLLYEKQVHIEYNTSNPC